MPWYKFTSKHGPGHMGHSECYRWLDETPTQEELRCQWEEAFRDYDDIVGKAVPVPRLPKRVLNSKKLSEMYKIDRAVKTLLDRFGIKVEVRFPEGMREALEAERRAYLDADRAKQEWREKKRLRETLKRSKERGWA